MSKLLVLSDRDEEEADAPLVVGTLVRCEYPYCGTIIYGKVVSITKNKFNSGSRVKVKSDNGCIYYCALIYVYRL